MKEATAKFFESWESTGKVDNDQLSQDFVYVGPSKMLTTEVWKELNGNAEAVSSNIISIVYENNSGAMLFEYQDEMTGLKYRVSWFLKFDEVGLLLELIETKESVET